MAIRSFSTHLAGSGASRNPRDAPRAEPIPQKCANDAQTALERAFPHCARAFKARKNALRNTSVPRIRTRSFGVMILVNGTANWYSKGSVKSFMEMSIAILLVQTAERCRASGVG